jgi:GTP cyclohydrolase I
MFARRLQVQERMTNEIADALVELLDPLGVGGGRGAARLRFVARR